MEGKIFIQGNHDGKQRSLALGLQFHSLLAEVSHDSFLPHRERPLLAGKNFSANKLTDL